ncbi:unnamed protein product [Cylicocyclus nassatus]|uniref:Uncharacterized protein n=1 Tax=Cylicocyclus nassatus TaxID=53992 RepID=A0AA36GM53_CYLNA|nr:unnamed protein product [Cylicocyclus nassatus]
MKPSEFDLLAVGDGLLIPAALCSSYKFAKYAKDLRLLQGQINNLRGQSTPRAGARESSIANSFQHRQQHKWGMDSKHIECLLGGVFASSPWSLTAMLLM